MKVPLPISTAIASIQWKLSTPSSPMYYEPIQSLKTLRHTKDVPPVLQPIISRGIYETIEDLNFSSGNEIDSNYKKHHLMLAMGLILLGNGYIDEAHDLITPLSWNEDTYFGGPTMVPEANESVVAIASYAHSLLHRREGYAQREFGMIGYQNAKYWSNAALSRSRKLGTVSSTFSSCFSEDCVFVYPSRKLMEEIIHLSNQHGPEAQVWCRENIGYSGNEKGEFDNHSWDPRVLHDLAANVSKGDGISEDLLRFAESVCEIELRLLLVCCLECAGYDVDDYSQKSSSKVSNIFQYESMDIDVSLAQRVANRISAAHIDAFRSNASVAVRKVLTLVGGEENVISLQLSVASGLACRLLGSPAVRCALKNNMDDDDDDANNSVYVFFPNQEFDASHSIYMTWKEKIGSTFYGGGDLSVGDAFCFQMEPNVESILENTFGLYRFLPCEPSYDKNACFHDKFYGSRGDTPTSVLQWSKGTIHRSI